MDSVAMQNRFRKFLKERDKILEEINQFLRAVLIYFLTLEDKYGFSAECIKSRSTPKICSLIESLCLIHALYGYPAAKSETGNVSKLLLVCMIIYSHGRQAKNLPNSLLSSS